MTLVCRAAAIATLFLLGSEQAHAARATPEKAALRALEKEAKQARDVEDMRQREMDAIEQREMDAARQGKILCLSTIPAYGCDSYNSVSFAENGDMHLESEVVFKLGPPTTATFTEIHNQRDEDGNCLFVGGVEFRNLKFYKNGEPLPELERPMFETVFRLRMKSYEKSAICILPTDQEDASAQVHVDGNAQPLMPPMTRTWHAPQELPPLIGGAKSILQRNALMSKKAK